MTEQRKLAAVMFTDITGYTALMSKDEQKAMKLLQKNREIQKDLAEKHHGEFLKEMGDGTLLCFQSALDAVRCAMEIQQSVKDDPDLNLRIGIHLGDIIFRGGDVFGDGVNVASRIEALAEAGDIHVSEQIYKLIRNQPDIQTTRLGEKQLKNVKHPVTIYAVGDQNLPRVKVSLDVEKPGLGKKKTFAIAATAIVLAFVIFTMFQFLPKAPALVENRIAVAYFDNETGESSYDHLEGMIADNLIQNLSKIDLIEVAPQVPHSTYKDNLDHKRLDIISKQTRSQLVVSGTIYKREEGLVIQPRITDMITGEPARAMPEISCTPSTITTGLEEIRKKVMGAILLIYDDAVKEWINYTAQIPDYEAIVKLREASNVALTKSQLESIPIANKAMEVDPDFVSPYILIITFYSNDPGYYSKMDSVINHVNDKYEDQFSLYEKMWIRFLRAKVDGDLHGRLRILRQMLEIDPNSVHQYSIGLSCYWVNNLFEADEWFSGIDREAPFVRDWPAIWTLHGFVLHLQRKYDEQLGMALDQRNRFPESISGLSHEISANIGLGNIDRVMDLFDEVYTLTSDAGTYLRGIAQELYVHGHMHEANVVNDKAMEWLRSRSEDEFGRQWAYMFDALYLSEFILDDKIRGDPSDTDESQITLIPGTGDNKAVLEELLDIVISDDPTRMDAMGRKAILAAKLGNRETALEIYDWFDDLDRSYLRGRDTRWKAIIVAHLGETSRAVSLLQDAFREGFQFSIDYHRNYMYEPLRSDSAFQEFIRPKR